MSLLDFPDEIILQIIGKLNLIDRINLSRTNTRLSPLCFDRSLQRKPMETLTLKELRKLYRQSRTENERNQCFNSNVLDRLRIKNFNEVVRLYMDPKHKQFVTNGKILHSLGGKFVLEGEREKFSANFVKKFLFLLERAEGTLFLAFVDIKRFGKMNEKRCAQILSSKLERRQKIYCIDFCKTISYRNSFAWYSIYLIESSARLATFYRSYLKSDMYRYHYLITDKRNSVAIIKELIDMTSGDSLIEAKQHLGNVLALVEAAALLDVAREITCDNCYAWLNSNDEGILSEIIEPAWSNCAGCELK